MNLVLTIHESRRAAGTDVIIAKIVTPESSNTSEAVMKQTSLVYVVYGKASIYSNKYQGLLGINQAT